jgi:hypothetical protein
MNTDSQLLDKEPPELLIDQLDAPTLEAQLDQATIARSESNILRWMEYLPEDCVARMIEMRWDVTT